MSNQSQKSSTSYAELKRKAMQTFFFDDEDLPSNREGNLSKKKKKRFVTTTKAGTIVFVLSGLVLSALFVWSLDRPMPPSLWAFPILGMVAFTAIGIYVYWLGNKVYKSGIVKSVIGAATFRIQAGNIFLQIGDEYFWSRRNFRKIFLPDIQYKVYYAPSDSRQLRITYKRFIGQKPAQQSAHWTLRQAQGRLVGFVAIFEHLSGFKFFLLLSFNNTTY